MSRLSFTSLVIVILFCAGCGYFYGVFLSEAGRGFIGMIFALAIFLPLLAFEQDLLGSGLRDRLKDLPTLVYFFAELAIYAALMSIAYVAAGTLLWRAGMMGDYDWAESAIIPVGVLVYSMGASALAIFILRVRDMLGRDVFLSLITSRYRKPVSQERIFLFLDLVGSTSFAERHGDLHAQRYLSAIFKTIAGPVARFGGSMDDYVGDAAIVSWRFADGIRDAACIRCVFAIFDEIEARADRWQRDFGETPRLRAALHGGPIVIAEIGVDHRKITYFGDTVNATARLESLCRTLGVPFLISTDLCSRIALPPEVSATPQGAFPVRGRGQELAVTTLSQDLSPTVQPRAMQ